MAKSIFEEKSCRNNSRELAKKERVPKGKQEKCEQISLAQERSEKVEKKSKKKKLNQIPICQEFVQF